MKKSIEEKFFDRIALIPFHSCWEWVGGISPNGYGHFSQSMGKQSTAHKYSYELHKGPVPKGLVIDHLCRNKSCVNPTHLEAVTSRENSRRSPLVLKSHCKNGHLFSADNVWIRKSRPDQRICKSCSKVWAKIAIDRIKKRALVA